MTDDLTISLSGSDWLGVVLATAAAFFVGFVWFTVLFGKRWAQEFGMAMGDEGSGFKGMVWPMVKDVVGNFVMAYVLLHSIVVWIPSMWDASWEDSSKWMYALWGGFFVWIGFFVPVALSRTGWERRSWAWFGIDAGYNLVRLMAMAFVLMAFH